jgi:outer membrane protein
MKQVLFLLALSFGYVVHAQAYDWSLRECINYALQHNITVQQMGNKQQQSEVSLSTARNSRLPNLSANASGDLTFGRALNASNTYVNRNTNSASFGLSSSTPLFTGYQIENTIKLQQLNLQAATADLEKARNDIRTQVAQAYVQILYQKEIAAVAHRQVSIDSMQVARLQSMMNSGKASGVEVSQQQATLANSQLTATKADNDLQLALLTLSQLLELPTPDGFSVVIPAMTDFSSHVSVSVPAADAVYAEALSLKPEVQAEQLRLRGTDYNIKVAQSGYYPQVYFNAGLGSNYYKTAGYDADGFGKQMSNNFNQQLGVSLSIPLFNRFSTRNQVRSARLERENQQLALDLVKKSLYKEIQQVYYNVTAAASKYRSSMQAVQSAKDAFTLMQAKYENGKANITEFNESKNNYLKAESDCVQSKYEYIYDKSLLDFYRGKELNF